MYLHEALKIYREKGGQIYKYLNQPIEVNENTWFSEEDVMSEDWKVNSKIEVDAFDFFNIMKLAFEQLKDNHSVLIHDKYTPLMFANKVWNQIVEMNNIKKGIE